ncbi:hypothetical protein X975_11071, partial [Stegodyphus mimosarum]
MKQFFYPHLFLQMVFEQKICNCTVDNIRMLPKYIVRPLFKRHHFKPT